MKEIVIYHNTENASTLIVIDGELISDGVQRVSFEHESNKTAKMQFSIEPKDFTPSKDSVERLKEKGFPFDMENL